MDRLEKDGLVRRRADPDDRRSVLAELTPAGEQAHAKGVRALADAQRAIVKALKAGEATSLQNALTALTSCSFSHLLKGDSRALPRPNRAFRVLRYLLDDG